MNDSDLETLIANENSVRDSGLMGISVAPGLLLIAGTHSTGRHGFCWCQPTVVSSPRMGADHRLVTHKRTLDETPVQSDARLGEGSPGWRVKRKGTLILPAAQEVAVAPRVG